MTSSSSAQPSREGLGLPLHLVSADLSGGGGGGSLAAGGSNVPTLTTPTLTPTTLRNIEQMFMDSDPCSDNGSSSHHANAARFEPPTISISELIKVKEEMDANAAAAAGIPGPPPPIPGPPLPSWIADGSVLPGKLS